MVITMIASSLVLLMFFQGFMEGVIEQMTKDTVRSQTSDITVYGKKYRKEKELFLAASDSVTNYPYFLTEATYSGKISRRNLRRIVREACGDLPPIQVEAEPVVVSEPAPVVESQEPVQQLVVEMELASRALEQVVESVQNAAHVCHDCGEQLAAQAPLMEAMASQAEALQEMLDAQATVVAESADFSFTGDVGELPGDEAFAVGYEAGMLGLE